MNFLYWLSPLPNSIFPHKLPVLTSQAEGQPLGEKPSSDTWHSRAQPCMWILYTVGSASPAHVPLHERLVAPGEYCLQTAFGRGQSLSCGEAACSQATPTRPGSVRIEPSGPIWDSSEGWFKLQRPHGLGQGYCQAHTAAHSPRSAQSCFRLLFCTGADSKDTP